MSEWQPIETAPRDGGEFLAYDPVSRKFDVCRMKDWCGWTCVPTQLDNYEGAEDGCFEGDMATHWMPLPEPPK